MTGKCPFDPKCDFDPDVDLAEYLASESRLYCWCPGDCENGTKPCPNAVSNAKFEAMSREEQLRYRLWEHGGWRHGVWAEYSTDTIQSTRKDKQSLGSWKFSTTLR